MYGFARIIFWDNEKAVRELALAIALANPTLFPDGKPRPLRVGERLTIPDLRTVQRIVADSGIAPDSVFPPLPKKSTKSRKAVPRPKKTRKVARSNPSATTSSVGRAKSGTGREAKLVRTATGDRRPAIRRTGQLGLMFALSLDLGPSIGMTDARRAVLRQQLRAAVAIDSGVSSMPESGPLSARVTQVGEAQDGINAQIKLLSSKVAALQESVTVQRSAMQGRPSTAQTGVPVTATPTAAVSATPVAAVSSAPAAAVSSGIAPPAVASTDISPPAATQTAGLFESTMQRTLSLWDQSSWWKWPAIAGLLLLLLVAAIVYRPRSLVQPSTDDDKERISNILEEARHAAIPVLGEDSIPPGGNAYDQASDTEDQGDAFYSESARTVVDPAARHVDDGETHVPSSDPIPPLYPDIIDPSTAGVVNQGLKREMADALDGARSMFSDVDRFIVLGRAENAISMLEFQIETHPEDRDAWVKLMAIYEQEGMNDEFERTYAAFGAKFGGA